MTPSIRWFVWGTAGLLAVFGGLGCAESTERPAGMDRQVYECPVEGRGETVEVDLWTGPDTASVTLPDRFSPRTRPLSPETGSGRARYTGDRIVVRDRGPAVRIDVDGDTLRGCAPASAWREARRRGVVFEGLGQEPGWRLEIFADTLHFAGDYGQRTVRVPRSSVSFDRTADRTVYRADSLTVVVEAAACTDVMSGAHFGHTVTVTVGGDTYRGCGRFLQ